MSAPRPPRRLGQSPCCPGRGPPDTPHLRPAATALGDLVAAAKAEPRKISFASPGAGSSTHMSAELFRLMTGTDLMHVPYKGSGQAPPDVISGRVSMMFETMPGAVGRVGIGRRRLSAAAEGSRMRQG